MVRSMHTTARRAAAILLIALLAGLLSAPSATAGVDDEMKMKQARKIFVKQICRRSAAIDRLNEAAFRGHDTVYAKDITPEWMRSINKAMDHLANIEHDVYGKLLFTPKAWPAVAEDDTLEAAFWISALPYALVVSETDQPGKYIQAWNNLLVPLSKKVKHRIGDAEIMLGIEVKCGGEAARPVNLRRFN